MNSLYVQDNFHPDLNEFPVRQDNFHSDLNELPVRTSKLSPDLNEFPVRTRQLLPGSKWIICTYTTTFTRI